MLKNMRGHTSPADTVSGRGQFQIHGQTVKTEPASPGKGMHPRYRTMVAASAVWFPLYLLLLAFLLSRISDPPQVTVIALVFAGNLLWLTSAYCIYDALFTLAEARWPAVKVIRSIVGPLLKSAIFHHHSS
jgi:hypothetical protein